MKKTRQNILLLALSAVITSGCSTFSNDDANRCPISKGDEGECGTMMETYAKIKKGQNQPKNTSTIPFQQDSSSASANGSLSNYPAPVPANGLVYSQPQVHRIWIAPSKDSDQNFKAGQDIYFTTEGSWSYLGQKGRVTSQATQKKNSAGNNGMFEPSTKNNLGFNPVEKAKKAAESAGVTLPPAPAEKIDDIKKNVSDAKNLVTETASGITKPYTRVGSD